MGCSEPSAREYPARQVDLVHIHTPFIAHYAAARFSRNMGLPCVATYHTFFEEYLHHYVPVLPRRIGRFLARSFTRSQCDDVQALIAPSDPMRDVLLEYGVSTPIHVLQPACPQIDSIPASPSVFVPKRGSCRKAPGDLCWARCAREEY